MGNGPDFKKIIDARKFARQRHGTQKYGDYPFSVYLKIAARNVTIWGRGLFSETNLVDLLCAVWLHDLVKSTPTTRGELVFFFGDRVAKLSTSLDCPAMQRDHAVLFLQACLIAANASLVAFRLHLDGETVDPNLPDLERIEGALRRLKDKELKRRIENLLDGKRLLGDRLAVSPLLRPQG